MRRRISTSAETLAEYLTSAFSREKIKGEIDNKDSTFLFLFVRDELGVRLAGRMGAEQQTDYLAGTRCNTPRKAAAIIDVFLLLQALDFAADGHRGQRRKDADKSPYSNHIITVADLVAPQIEHAPRGSTRAKPIQLADKIANARDIIERLPVGWSRERREEYPKWSADIVAGCWRTKPSLEQLFDEVLERGRPSPTCPTCRWRTRTLDSWLPRIRGVSLPGIVTASSSMKRSAARPCSPTCRPSWTKIRGRDVSSSRGLSSSACSPASASRLQDGWVSFSYSRSRWRNCSPPGGQSPISTERCSGDCTRRSTTGSSPPGNGTRRM